jgi:subtilisin family serine protease
MRRRANTILLLSLLVLIVGNSSAGAAPSRHSYIVVFAGSVEAPAHVAHEQVDRFGGELGFVYRHAFTGYSAQLPNQAIEALRRDPRVRHVITDRHVDPVEEIEIDTYDSGWAEPESAVVPTGISRTFAASNKALDIDGQDDVRANVDVAVLDSGIDPSQADLNVVNRVDCTQKAETCIANSGTPGDHATHVAGIIGAFDNGFGVVGIAPGARLWSVKVLGANGGEWSWVLAGIDFVLAHAGEIEVANMSLGGAASPVLSETLSKALGQARDNGLVYAVAAGNQGIDAKNRVPANVGSALTVSAIADYDGQPNGKASPTCQNWGLDDRLASFSNFGPVIDIAAPGVCIASTEPGNTYGMKSGTSMATPYVSGAAALLAAKSNPNTKSDVEAIQSQLISQGNLEWVDTSGDGIKEKLLDVHNESVFSLVAAPAVTTGGVSFTAVGSEMRTTMTGTVTPNGLNTSYQFEYVSAAKYKSGAENPYAEGSKVPLTATEIGSGSKGEPLPAQQALTGLEPGTTYHYRLVAENAKGVSKGQDETFTSCKGSEGKCAWSLQSPASVGAVTTYDFEDVSCPSATSCLAVGYDGYHDDGLLQLWNGSEWKRLITFPGQMMKAISCPTTIWCMTVAKSESGWKLQWSEFVPGSGWYQEKKAPPKPEGASEMRLQDVSCTSTSACTVVGRYNAGGDKPYVARWNGTSWSLQTAPSPSEGTASEAMLGVSCASSSYCVAVGTAAKKPFAERWNGSEWAIQSAPNPSGATEAALEGVSCPTSSACMAVGSFKGSSGPVKALSESWNGSSWSALSNPAPSKEGSVKLRSVSCASASSCIAVGFLADSLALPKWEQTVAQAWNGSAWSNQASLNPEEKPFNSFAGVSCSAATACTAVGDTAPVSWAEGSIGKVPLAERWE